MYSKPMAEHAPPGVTGAFLALVDALTVIKEQEKWPEAAHHGFRPPATSVGIVNGVPMLDLCYEEDCRAQVDMNVVMTAAGRFVEIQGTAEESPFGWDEMEEMLLLAQQGIRRLVAIQREVLPRRLWPVLEEGRLARLVVASRNEHKIKEIQAILADQPWQVLTAHDFPGFPEVVEDGSTLEANAIKKAKEIAAFTGCLALADDTGLEVDALGGKPGVHSGALRVLRPPMRRITASCFACLKAYRQKSERPVSAV